MRVAPTLLQVASHSVEAMETGATLTSRFGATPRLRQNEFSLVEDSLSGAILSAQTHHSATVAKFAAAHAEDNSY